jgi:hypothetical protein
MVGPVPAGLGEVLVEVLEDLADLSQPSRQALLEELG